MEDTPVKKNDVIEIDIDDVGYDGAGIAHVGGYTVFINYALKGERVRALIILTKRTFAVGKLQAVLVSSPDRCEPICPVYYKCGGCELQHMNYAAQLSFKRAALIETFRKARIEINPAEVIPSDKKFAYRNKMSLPVRGTSIIGFFASASHRVVPIEHCPIQFDCNRELIVAFREYLIDNGIDGYNETTGGGIVRHLSVRKLGDFVTVTVVANGRHKDMLASFDDKLKKLYGENYAYYINYNDKPGNRILGDESEFIGGSTEPVIVDGLKTAVHPQSFFQVNDGVRRALYEYVAAQAGGGKVIDAYSGAGVLSALLAKKAESVTAVEIEPKAVQSAKKMLELNGIENVKLICGDCAEKLPEVTAGIGEYTLVLDPPRAGCSEKVLSAAAQSKPKKIIYISCNPATLARDIFFLKENGYEVNTVTPFDMFPQTVNLETVAVLSRK